MERQLLEIQQAFDAFVADTERERTGAEDHLREAERQKNDAEDLLREAEDQLREVAWQLRKLQKAPAVRLIRFFQRLNPLRSARERLR